ncbi:tRNA guanosine(34) transglycosylase Tgt [Corynebacterium sp. 320]|uniref:tRNA guanosine(34) transglycosylase Tgt n=1 Tax=Corynebacterium TaxID=1716 RepID=UPI00125CBF4D|nr:MULTISPECIES: tRNA guanosine(34) transglycosylase Tgt [Corynebacterium]KAB1502838.1 tRNA guanosine(34) transglycosylase Tgt [Corynebacterium sp. 320]KAB1552349.1 tRNA guanosine(34) transglycosylase Tgt [Corynebacterium sp. 321]KAB1554436.1 tRNA guanosine(34) transglycosylase Tgt [Corynebacterium sp. 319]KAB3526501.1 tRNA guanosine(34) transglycosylase Tgt [Corynebacterium sp. 250]KAB3539821.1 tRNA guanosine(34) transglycosylase Tgt [Corynebacterium sp. 366]
MTAEQRHTDTTFSLGTRLEEDTRLPDSAPRQTASAIDAAGNPVTSVNTENQGHGRTGVIHTPHGDIHTPAFIPVGTKATVKTLTPQQVRSAGAQAVLSNAYHLYLQPGPEIVDQAGGVAAFENWHGPTYTDSGGFQVMSLGVGFKKVLAMDTKGLDKKDIVAQQSKRMAVVDEDGVDFRSVIDGSKHRFTPEVSMQIQHQLGADIIFAFDELTTLVNTRHYQERSVERTHRWAQRCLEEHYRQTVLREDKPLQSLWGVVQGAQYEDLRKQAARGLVELSDAAIADGRRGFGGYGIGGALEKENLGTIVNWVCEELPENMPRHLLGISEPDDLFTGVAAGADTFDCVAPTRLARRGGVYTLDGRMNLTNARFKNDFSPIDAEVGGEVSENYSRAYIHHLLKAKEFLAGTLCTMHNLHFMITLVDNIRRSIEEGRFVEYRAEFMSRYYGEGWEARLG